MTSKARQLADLGGDTANLEDISSVLSSGPLSNRNLIINGAMQVAQRGTSFSSISSITYPVDRFIAHDVSGGSGEATVSQSTTTPDNFKYSLKWDVTTASTPLNPNDQYKVEYRIEGQDIAHLNWGTSTAQTVTLSFWVRSNKTGNTQVSVLNSANNRSYVAPFTINTANTWEKKELVISGDVSGTWLDTNGIGLRLRWGSYGSTYQTPSLDQWVAGQFMSTDSSPINFMDNTANEFYLTGVQLEVGDTATPFEHRSYGQELALCQRYYYKTQDNFYSMHFVRSYNSGNTYYGLFQLPVPMRADPSISFESNSIRLPSIADTTGTFSTYTSGTHAQIIQCVPASDYGSMTYTVMARTGLRADAEL